MTDRGKGKRCAMFGEKCSLQSTCTLVMMPFARVPKRSEDSVSAALAAAGEQQMIRAMRAFPPNVSCSTRELKVRPDVTICKI